MRHPITLAIAVATAFISVGAYAAEKTSNPCSALDWHDIESLGAKNDTFFSEAGWHQEKTPDEVPEGKLFTNMCAGVIKAPEGRTSVTLSFDSFRGKASAQQIRNWLKAADAADTKEGESEVKTVRIGDANCESGRYDLATANDLDDSVTTVTEYYVACDQQVGNQHLSLNVHVPEGRKATLPSAEQAKALLDKSIARVKTLALGAPAQ